MKIGVYGGTFNPPHLGHVTAARAVFELLKLDLLLLVPDGQPPHKMLPPGSPTPEQRLEMTRLAGEQLGLGERVRTLDLELKREGRSYTAETLRQLHQQYPEDELYKEISFLAYYFHWSYETVMQLDHRTRRRFCAEISEIHKKVSGKPKNIFEV